MGRQILIRIIDDGIDDLTAMERVARVIKEGKVSNGRNGNPCYCFVTIFGDDVTVSSSGESKHPTFVVYKRKDK